MKKSVTVKTPEQIYLEDLINRHSNHLKTAKAGYIRDVTYAETMEIHRYIDKALGRDSGMNHSCASCVLEMYKLFIRMNEL